MIELCKKTVDFNSEKFDNVELLWLIQYVKNNIGKHRLLSKEFVDADYVLGQEKDLINQFENSVNSNYILECENVINKDAFSIMKYRYSAFNK